MKEKTEDLTMIKLPDGKIINKKSNEINLKPDDDDCRDDDTVTPIH
jgi:hypothetical protein